MSGDPFDFGGGKKKKKEKTTRGRAPDIQESILEDETISEQTRTELLGDLSTVMEGISSSERLNEMNMSRRDLDLLTLDVEEQFKKAKTGEGKFKSRQETEKMFEVAMDQPGSRQTRLASGTNRNNILGI